MPLTSFIQSIANALVVGDSDFIIDHLVWPFPFYLDNHPLVLPGPKAGEQAFAEISAGLQRAGVHSVTTRLIAQGLPHGGKAAHFFQFLYLDGNGKHLRSATLRFWLDCSDNPEMPRIEMAEVRPMAFPELLTRLGLTTQKAS